mmetsp:Transcript_13051/g.21020  ORF Transcript_13051/g.21020 Transcript_13051/m.21020 type:complete len:207 (-) Transcript_13051:552-1172(-)
MMTRVIAQHSQPFTMIQIIPSMNTFAMTSGPATAAVEQTNRRMKEAESVYSWTRAKKNASLFVSSKAFELCGEEAWPISCMSQHKEEDLGSFDPFPGIAWFNEEDEQQVQEELEFMHRSKRQRHSPAAVLEAGTIRMRIRRLRRSMSIHSHLCELDESALNNKSSYFLRAHTKTLLETLAHVNGSFPIKDELEDTPGFGCSMTVVA